MYFRQCFVPIQVTGNHIVVCSWKRIRVFTLFLSRFCRQQFSACIIIPINRFLYFLTCSGWSVIAHIDNGIQIRIYLPVQRFADIDSRNLQFIVSTFLSPPVQCTPRSPSIGTSVDSRSRQTRLWGRLGKNFPYHTGRYLILTVITDTRCQHHSIR